MKRFTGNQAGVLHFKSPLACRKEWIPPFPGIMGAGMRTEFSWRDGIPWERLNQAPPDVGSPPTAKAETPQQPAAAGFPFPLLPPGFPNPQARTRGPGKVAASPPGHSRPSLVIPVRAGIHRSGRRQEGPTLWRGFTRARGSRDFTGADVLPRDCPGATALMETLDGDRGDDGNCAARYDHVMCPRLSLCPPPGRHSYLPAISPEPRAR